MGIKSIENFISILSLIMVTSLPALADEPPVELTLDSCDLNFDGEIPEITPPIDQVPVTIISHELETNVRQLIVHYVPPKFVSEVHFWIVNPIDAFSEARELVADYNSQVLDPNPNTFYSEIPIVACPRCYLMLTYDRPFSSEVSCANVNVLKGDMGGIGAGNAGDGAGNAIPGSPVPGSNSLGRPGETNATIDLSGAAGSADMANAAMGGCSLGASQEFDESIFMTLATIAILLFVYRRRISGNI